MGDASDDVYEAAEQGAEVVMRMMRAGCRICPRWQEHDENECPVCLDFGWLDASGQPCEP